MNNVQKSIKLIGLALFLCAAMTVAATAKTEEECKPHCGGAHADKSFYDSVEKCDKDFEHLSSQNDQCVEKAIADCMTACKNSQ